MSNKIWEKINYFCGFLPLGALFGLVAFVANVEIQDLDLWLHLAMGKIIVQNHYVPLVDVLSCSIKGTPWINHEWLFQVIVYFFYQHCGAEGVLRLQAVIVTLTMFLLLLLGYNKERQLLTTFLLLLVYLVFQQRFTTRPDLFSLFFFACYMFILALHIYKKWSSVS